MRTESQWIKSLNTDLQKDDIMDMKHIKISELSENTLIQVSQRVVAFLYFGSIWKGMSMFLMNSNGIRHLWVPWNSNSNTLFIDFIQMKGANNMLACMLVN